MNEPRVVLTKRYLSPMDMLLPAVARLGLTDSLRGSHALCKQFQYGREPQSTQRVVVYESVLKDARADGAGIVFAQERQTGDVFEFDLQNCMNNALYEVEYGEGMFYTELKEAEYRWVDLGDGFYTNETFWNP